MQYLITTRLRFNTPLSDAFINRFVTISGRSLERVVWGATALAVWADGVEEATVACVSHGERAGTWYQHTAQIDVNLNVISNQQ